MGPSRCTAGRWLLGLLPGVQCAVETPASLVAALPAGAKRTRPLKLLSSYSRATDRPMLIGPKSTASDSVCTFAGFPQVWRRGTAFRGVWMGLRSLGSVPRVCLLIPHHVMSRRMEVGALGAGGLSLAVTCTLQRPGVGLCRYVPNSILTTTVSTCTSP